MQHSAAAVGKTQQQMLLVLAKLFLQRVELAGGLINVVLGANDADAAGSLTQQRLRYHIRPVVKLFRRLQYRLSAGFLYAARTAQHPRDCGFRHPS